jgi:hypothetical protein
LIQLGDTHRNGMFESLSLESLIPLTACSNCEEIENELEEHLEIEKALVDSNSIEHD